ncbi:Gfo/Idh/MocA family protein, partial [Gemmatimonadota bacterium]
MSKNKKVTRREFLEKSAIGTAGLTLTSSFGAPAFHANPNPSDVLGVGFIGVGVRGIQHVRDVMNIPGTKILGICDIYTGHMERALKTVNDPDVKSYIDYRELLENKDIDAVVIATPDHWHSKMTVDAANAGKDIYIEKGLTRTLAGAKAIVKAVKKNKSVLQLGHQGRSRASTARAREIWNSGILGDVSLIMMTSLDNSFEDRIHWRWYSNYGNFEIPPDADEQHIDWQRFLGDAPQRPFDLRRYFHWRCYWDYGTGIAGDEFSHTFDGVNAVTGLGIPKTCVASGGVYYWHDDREVPDLWNVIYDYPDRSLAMTYTRNKSASGSGIVQGGTHYCGHNATLSGGSVYLEPYNDKNLEVIEKLREERRQQGKEVGRREAIPVDTPSRDEEQLITSHMQNFIDCVRTR